MYAAEAREDKSYWIIKDEGTLADFLPTSESSDLVSLTRYATHERAKWVADIVEMRRQHGAGPNDVEVKTWPGQLDNALIELVDETARGVERLAAERQLKSVNERDHLQPQCAGAAKALTRSWTPSAEASTQMTAEFDEWPNLGKVDMALTWPNKLPVLLELKCGSGLDGIAQCVWDAAKLAFAMQCRKGTAMFLLAATRREDWERPVRGAEFFADGAHEAALLRVLYGDWFRQFERLGDPQPTELPRSWWTEYVHAAEFEVDGTDWELRLAQVFCNHQERLPWPRLT